MEEQRQWISTDRLVLIAFLAFLGLGIGAIMMIPRGGVVTVRKAIDTMNRSMNDEEKAIAILLADRNHVEHIKQAIPELNREDVITLAILVMDTAGRAPRPEYLDLAAIIGASGDPEHIIWECMICAQFPYTTSEERFLEIL